MLMMKLFLCLLIVALWLPGCNSREPINKYSDPIHFKILEFQDRRQADSLYPYFNHEDPAYRLEAVQAFGSLQDRSASDRIEQILLLDNEASVRSAAAFALGQMYSSEAEPVLLEALAKEKNPEVSFEVLQAYGKTTKRWALQEDRFLTDSIETAGLAWSIYRAGLRGKTDSTANRVAMQLLKEEYPQSARLGAAHFFARGAVGFAAAESALIQTAQKDASPEVRMAAALALGKIPSDSSLATLKRIYKNEKDRRVIINTIRAFSAFPYNHVKHYLYEALNHKDTNVGIAASEVILTTISPDDWIEVAALTNRLDHWRIQANIYEAALKGGHGDLAKEIQKQYKLATDPYHRAALLSSLAPYAKARVFVYDELLKADTPVIRSSAASTLVRMNRSKTFTVDLQRQFTSMFTKLMESDDAAVVGIIAAAFADSTLRYRKRINDTAFLYKAKDKLQLPQDIEALQAVEEAIAYFENRKVDPVKNSFNHPVSRELLETIPASQSATIKTSRGNIVIRLLVEEAPGSVANFISLAQKDYFDNKFFHRVVPNFVVQAGCHRGDGWGSENYSIRSEFSPRMYTTGSVGMASAGKDTEGTQWFITHSPTPHLDGRYTIFAEVTQGMAVVHYLEVGDKILDVVVETSQVH